MSRKEGWENELAVYLDKVSTRSFKRGKHDCALFVCNCIKILTGVDYAAEYRGKYKTKKEAFQMLKERGFEDLSKIAFGKLGDPYKNINFAKRGDLVTLDCKEGISLGIIDMTGKRAVTTGEKALTYYPKDQWIQAWEV